MDGEFYFILTIVAGCALLVAGVQLISNNLLELFEKPIYKMIRIVREDQNITFFKGMFFSTISASSLVASTTLLNLVNAGLIKLRAANLFLAGANIGPFILLGLVIFLNLKLGLIFLSLSILAQIFVHSRFGKWFQNAQRFLFGLGLICLAKHFLTDGVRIINGANQGILGNITSGPFLLSFITGLFFGALICYLLRSSLLTILLFMVVRDSAIISFSLLLPAVIGAHSIGFVHVKKMAELGNIYAQRLAASQLALSIIGLVLGLFCLYFENYIPSTGDGLFIVLFFALLRFASVLIFICFLAPITKIIHYFYPKESYPDTYKLNQLGKSREMIPAMALLQCSFHVAKLKNIVDRLFSLTEEYLHEEVPSARILAKIKDYERITDNIHQEINRFVGQLMVNTLTYKQSQSLQSIVKIVDELESIADFIDKLASYNTRYQQENGVSNGRGDLMQLFADVKNFYFDICEDLPHRANIEQSSVTARAQGLKITAESIREIHLKKLSELKMEPVTLMTYSDMIVCLRKIRGHVFKIYNAAYRP